MMRGSERQVPHLRAMRHTWLSLVALAMCVIMSGSMSFAQRLPVGDGASAVTSALVSEGRIYATSVNQVYRENDAGVMERLVQNGYIVEVQLFDENDGVILARIVTNSNGVKATAIATTRDGKEWTNLTSVDHYQDAVSGLIADDRIAVLTVSKVDASANARLLQYSTVGAGFREVSVPFIKDSAPKLHRKSGRIFVSGYLPGDTSAVFRVMDGEPNFERLYPDARRVIVPTSSVNSSAIFHGSGDTLAVDGMPSRVQIVLPEGASAIPYEFSVVDTTILLEAAGRFLVSTNGVTWTRMIKRPARFTEQNDDALYANDSIMLFSQRSIGLWTYRPDTDTAIIGPTGMHSLAGFTMGKADGYVLLANSIVKGRYALEMWKPEGAVASRNIIHTDAYISRIFSTEHGTYIADPANGLREVLTDGPILEPRGLVGRTITSFAANDGVRLAAADGRLYGQQPAVSDDWALVDVGEGQPMDMLIRNDTAYVVMRVIDHEEGLQSYMLAVVDLRAMAEVQRHTLVRDGDGLAFHWMVGTDSTLVVYLGGMLLSSGNGGESWGGNTTEIAFAGVPSVDGTGWCVPCRNATSIGICVSADAETWYGYALDIPDVDKGIAVVSGLGYTVGTVDGVYAVTGPLTSVGPGDHDGPYISDDDVSGPGTVTIIDMRGNIVLREHMSQITSERVAMVTRTMDAGLYICVVDNGVRRVVRKIVNYR